MPKFIFKYLFLIQESCMFFVDDLHKVMKDCTTKFIVTIPDLVPTVKAAKQGLSGIKARLLTFL